MALILVIEDNEVNLELMTYLLQAHGHRTLAARNGLEGLSLARRERPDLVVCDIQMPGLGGYGVAAALRGEPGTATIPLVAVTAAAMVGDRERALAAGFDAHVAKPIEPADFVRRLEPFLEPGDGGMPRSAPGESQAIGEVPAALCAPRPGLVLLLVDDHAVHQELKRQLLEPAGYGVLTADGGEAAWSLLQRQTVHAVVSDVVMPGLGGLALLRRLRADPRLAALPFAFLTSTARDEASRREGLARGADRYLVRPIEAHALLAELRSLLESPAQR